MNKRFTIITIALALCMGAMAQDVKIKKGKATMSEADYTELKAKADQFESMSQKLTQAQNALRKERQNNTKPQMTTYIDSASYAIGRDLFNNWEQQNLGINVDMVAQSLKDCANGTNTWGQEQLAPLLSRFQQEFEKRQQALVQSNIKEGEAYLEQISHEKGVVKTASGLLYKKVKAGNGKKATATSHIKCHYTGSLINGKVFDSSVQRGTPIEGTPSQFIKGWGEGLQLMDEGSTYMLYIPYQLGYGERGAGEIPGGSALIFEVQLLEVK